jgi:hypothetical protein
MGTDDLKLAKTQNSEQLIAQLNPMPIAPLQQGCVHSGLKRSKMKRDG